MLKLPDIAALRQDVLGPGRRAGSSREPPRPDPLFRERLWPRFNFEESAVEHSRHHPSVDLTDLLAIIKRGQKT